MIQNKTQNKIQNKIQNNNSKNLTYRNANLRESNFNVSLIYNNTTNENRSTIIENGKCLQTNNALQYFTLKYTEENTVYYIVLGLGCSFIKDYGEFKKNLFRYFSTTFRNNVTKIKIYCNSLHKTIYNILFRRNPKIRDSHFINSIKDEIIKDLNIGKYICVIGHSYGGYIVSKIAENLEENVKDRKKLENLLIFTFGTIYIPPTILKSVRIIHFLNKIDISLRLVNTDYDKLFKSKTPFYCLNLPGSLQQKLIYINSIKNNQVFFIQLIDSSEKEIHPKINDTKRFLLKTLKKEWKCHNDYIMLMYYIINFPEMRTYLENLILEKK